MGQEFFQSRIVESSFGFGRGILLLEDCEGYIQWSKSGTGGDDILTMSNVAAFRGSYGMRLKTRTTGAAAGDEIFASRCLGWPESGRLVYRARIRPVGDAAIASVGLQLAVGNGVRIHLAGLAYYPNTGEVKYVDDTGGWVAIAALGQLILDIEWVSVEIVLDVLTFAYVSVCCNGLRASLAGVGMYDSGASTRRYVNPGVQVLTAGAAPAEAYADDFYVGEFLV
jgi:hypothetical protein